MFGTLEIETGPMYSGKSQRLVEAYNVMVSSGLRVGAFQPDKNVRDDGIVSRAGHRIPAGKITTLNEVDANRYDAVVIDEFQFFDMPEAEVSWCVQARDLGKTVLVGTIDYDYRGKLMPAFEMLNRSQPNHISFLTARCGEPVGCNEPARYTARLIDGIQQTDGPQIIIEEKDAVREEYSPRCGNHFLPLVSLQPAEAVL